jgi:WD40 repeat protein
LRGHGSSVLSVTFSPDGKFLASGNGDKTVKVWEVGSWREVATLRGHGSSVLSVTFSPDGKFLASGSNTTVKVWEVGDEKPVKVFRQR